MNCGLLSISIVDRKPNFDMQWSMNIVETAVTVVRAAQIAFLSLEFRSVITTMIWFPHFALANGASMSMAAYLNVPGGGTRRSFLSLLFV